MLRVIIYVIFLRRCHYVFHADAAASADATAIDTPHLLAFHVACAADAAATRSA